MLQHLIPGPYPLLLAGICLFSLPQCHKTSTNPESPGPLVKPPKSMHVIEGNNLIGGISINLLDTIVVRIIPNDPSDAEKYSFNSSANDAVGNLQVANLELDSGGVNVTVFWRTGSQSSRQDIQFYLLANCTNKGCQILDSVTISASIKQPWTSVYAGSGALTDIRFLSDQSALAVGQNSAGIVRTTDGGLSWSSSPAFRDDLEQLCFLDSLTGFVTVSNNFAYATADGGATFTQGTWTPPIIGDGSSRDFSMVSPNTIYSVGVQANIAKSVDGGQSWQKYRGFTFINEFFAVTCVDSNNCFACGETGKVVKTSNGGQDWQSLNIDLNNQLYSICFLDKSTGFAGGQNGVLIRTTDGGSTWSHIQTGLHFNIFSIRFFDMQHGVLVSDQGEIADTQDRGATWQKQCPPFNGVFSLQKAAIKDPKTVFAIIGGSIFKFNITP